MVSWTVLVAATVAHAQPAVTSTTPTQPVYGTPVPADPVEALGRYLRVLSTMPRNLDALTGAGKSALAIGDANAAISFFARAEEISPRDGRIKFGLASALVQVEQPKTALKLFGEAVSLGVPEGEVAGDRGLAYDLRGENRRAQADYTQALRWRPDDEITRRLAVSQAISGDRQAAMATLDALLRRQDRAAWRVRAFVLALTGDRSGAEEAALAVMPRGQAEALLPYFGRLAALGPGEKAAAVHLGQFPADRRTITPSQPVFSAAATPVSTPAPVGGPRSDVPQIPPATTYASNQPIQTNTNARAPRRRPGAAELAAAAPVTAAPAPNSYAVAAAQPVAPQIAAQVQPRGNVPGPSASPAYPVASAATSARPTATWPAAATAAVPPAAQQPSPAVVPAPTAPTTVARATVPPPTPAPVTAGTVLTALTAPTVPSAASSVVASTPTASPPTTSLAMTAQASPSASVPLPQTQAATTSSPGFAADPLAPQAVAATTTERPAATFGPQAPVELAAASPATVSTSLGASAPMVRAVELPGSTVAASPTTPPAASAQVTSPAIATPAQPVERASAPAPAAARQSRVIAPVAKPAVVATPAKAATDTRSAGSKTALRGKDGARAKPSDEEDVATKPAATASRDAKAKGTVAKNDKTAGKDKDRSNAKADAASADAKDSKSKATGSADAKGSRTKEANAKDAKEAAAKDSKAKDGTGKDGKSKDAATREAKADDKSEKAAKVPAGERYWVQVASGANRADLGKAWERTKAKAPKLLGGRTTYTAPWKQSNRLLVGPFKSEGEAQGFVNSLAKAGTGGIQFTSRGGMKVEPLGNE